MHQFILNNYHSSSQEETISNGTVYQGKRRANDQNVAIFELHISTLLQLQHFINEFVTRLVLRTGAGLNITDWHADLSQNAIIFAAPLEKKESAINFIDEIVHSTQEIPNRISSCYKNLKKLDVQMGDDGDTPQEMNFHSKKPSEIDLGKKDPVTTDSKIGSNPTDMHALQLKPLPSKAPVIFDVNKVKHLIQDDFSTWKLVEQEKNLNVFGKLHTEGDPKVYGGIQGVFPDGDIDVWAQMNLNPEIRREWDKTYPKIKQLQVYSEKEDILYLELKLPFPFSNRDLVLSRYYLNSDNHAEEIERLGFPKTSRRRWVIMQHSVDLSEHPPHKGVERAENYAVFTYEQDAQDPKMCYNKAVSIMELKGNIPVKMIQKSVGKSSLKQCAAFREAFFKNRQRWSQMIKK